MPYFHIYLHYKPKGEDKIGYPNDINFSSEMTKDIVRRYENGESFLLQGFTIHSDPSCLKRLEIFKTQNKIPSPPDWNEIGRTAENVTKNFTILPPGARSPTAVFSKLKLHPKIREASEDLFKNGHYAEAIFNAFREVESFVKEKSGISSRSGQSLMTHVFNEGHPIIKLNPLENQADIDEQAGFRFLFMGGHRGIRDPKAHVRVVQPDPHRTLKYLAFASLLMERADEGTLESH